MTFIMPSDRPAQTALARRRWLRDPVARAAVERWLAAGGSHAKLDEALRDAFLARVKPNLVRAFRHHARRRDRALTRFGVFAAEVEAFVEWLEPGSREPAFLIADLAGPVRVFDDQKEHHARLAENVAALRLTLAAMDADRMRRDAALRAEGSPFVNVRGRPRTHAEHRARLVGLGFSREHARAILRDLAFALLYR